MNKYKFTILYLAVFIFCLVIPFSAMADLDILMNATSSPATLFDEDSVLPGDSFTRSISVTNSEIHSYHLATKAMNDLDPDGLGEKMTLRIVDDLNHEYFSGTLAEFFTRDAIDLSQIKAGVSRRYDYIVYFDKNTDNVYQSANILFDIAIGYGTEDGVGFTGATSIEDQFLASQSQLGENASLRGNTIFDKNNVWQVFGSAFIISSANASGENIITNKGFSFLEFSLVSLFVISFFAISFLLKRRSV